MIGPEGSQIGVIPIEQALTTAAEFGLDLVEVSPNAKPPVCKIMDYGRFKYEQTKKQQEAKKKQSTFQVKEIKVRPKTGDHDLEVQVSGKTGGGSDFQRSERFKVSKDVAPKIVEVSFASESITFQDR